jgi:hypothetical protein
MNEIVQAALSHGWMGDVGNPHNALTAAAKRLVSDGEVQRGERPGSYRYKPDLLPPLAPEVTQEG